MIRVRVARWVAGVGMWVALALRVHAAEGVADADYALRVVRIALAPGSNAPTGCRISGSNDQATKGFVALAPVAGKPGADGWLTINVPPGPVYRYVKIEAAADVNLALREVEFLGAAGRLAGAAFGTAGEKAPEAWKAACDGDPATAFAAPIGGAYVGLDLGQGAQCPAPRFEPACGVYREPQRVKLVLWPAGAAIRYTTDGSAPSETHGDLYAGPIAVTGSLGIAAIAFRDGRAASRVAIGAYAIGAQAAELPRVTTYHVGNSLTDTVVGWMEPLSWSAGKNYTFRRKTIPGCGLEGNWESNGKGFGDADYEKVLAAGVTHLFLQVFPNPPGLVRDGNAGIHFMELAQRANPDAQVWLYAQWPSQTGWEHDAHCVGAGWMKPEWFPSNRKPTNWDEAMLNKMEYYRTILDIWNKANAGKPVRLCPGGPALLALKREVEAGRVAGVTNFFGAVFSDGIHMTGKGAYLVSLVHYACIYGENPRGKVTFAGSGLDAGQADLIQRLAWEAVIGEPASGIKETTK